jgi:hypothetical protein
MRAAIREEFGMPVGTAVRKTCRGFYTLGFDAVCYTFAQI